MDLLAELELSTMDDNVRISGDVLMMVDEEEEGTAIEGGKLSDIVTSIFGDGEGTDGDVVTKLISCDIVTSIFGDGESVDRKEGTKLIF